MYVGRLMSLDGVKEKVKVYCFPQHEAGKKLLYICLSNFREREKKKMNVEGKKKRSIFHKTLRKVHLSIFLSRLPFFLFLGLPSKNFHAPNNILKARNERSN